MSAISDFFTKIYTKIEEIGNTLSSIQAGIQKLQHAWDLFFSLVPWEVLLLLLFSVILLSVFNSLSPKSPKLNFTLAILILCIFWVYFWGLFSDSISYLYVVKIALYLLVPLHALGFFQLVILQIRKYRWKKARISPSNWQAALQNVSASAHQLLGKSHLYYKAPEEHQNELLQEIQNLEESLSGMKSLLTNQIDTKKLDT